MEGVLSSERMRCVGKMLILGEINLHLHPQDISDLYSSNSNGRNGNEHLYGGRKEGTKSANFFRCPLENLELV